MLIRLYASNNDGVAALDLVNAESDATVTPHMLASAISACGGGQGLGPGLGQGPGGGGGGGGGYGSTIGNTGNSPYSNNNNRRPSSSSSSSSSSLSWKEALVLLQRGIRLSKADEAVFTGTSACDTPS